jgi:hypothetical protein
VIAARSFAPVFSALSGFFAPHPPATSHARPALSLVRSWRKRARARDSALTALRAGGYEKARAAARAGGGAPSRDGRIAGAIALEGVRRAAGGLGENAADMRQAGTMLSAFEGVPEPLTALLAVSDLSGPAGFWPRRGRLPDRWRANANVADGRKAVVEKWGFNGPVTVTASAGA